MIKHCNSCSAHVPKMSVNTTNLFNIVHQWRPLEHAQHILLEHVLSPQETSVQRNI